MEKKGYIEVKQPAGLENRVFAKKKKHAFFHCFETVKIEVKKKCLRYAEIYVNFTF